MAELRIRPFRPHQQRAFDFVRDRNAVGLFMEMRLGKTMVAIRWAEHRWPNEHKLVVAPKSTLPGWVEELRLEGHGSRIIDDLYGWQWTNAWCLVNFEYLREHPDDILNGGNLWGAIIVDESVRIRNPKAEITKVLCHDAPWRMVLEGSEPVGRMILSGLPNPEKRELDLFMQFVFLHGHLFGEHVYWKFRDRFFTNTFGHDYAPKRELMTRLRAFMHDENFVLTRKQAGLEPTKIRQRRYVDLEPRQRALYRKIKREFASDTLETKWSVAQYNWLRQVCGGHNPEGNHLWGPKVRELMTLIGPGGELEGEPVVVWFAFNKEMVPVKDALRKAGIPFAQIIGKTTLANRTARIRMFNQSRVQVLLMQVKVGKYGLNLSHADIAIYYSNNPSQDDRAQSEDRVLDIGKDKSLLIIDLVARDTVDEELVLALGEKRASSRSLLTRMIDRLRKKVQEENT